MPAPSARARPAAGRGNARRRGGDPREIPTRRRAGSGHRAPADQSAWRAELDTAAIDAIDDWQPQSSPGRWVRLLSVVPLGVASLIALVTLLRLLPEARAGEAFWRNPAVRWFFLGAASVPASLLLAPLRRPLRALYVLGHELSHCLAVYLSLGWVSRLRWGADGGYIVANRHNTGIALAPYLLPFWAMSWSAWLFAWSRFVEIPHLQAIFCLGLGAGVAFHLLFTLWMSSMEQSDFLGEGLPFSLLLISLVNVLWLLFLVERSDPGVDWPGIADAARASAHQLWRLAGELWQPTA